MMINKDFKNLNQKFKSKEIELDFGAQKQDIQKIIKKKEKMVNKNKTQGLKVKKLWKQESHDSVDSEDSVRPDQYQRRVRIDQGCPIKNLL